MFEIVYTCTDWYDGPRKGIADYEGHPHLFESKWQDGKDLDTNVFALSPLDAETLQLALEDWAIWRRWETAFYQGQAAQETHPALPEERARYEELQRLLKGRLVVDAACAVRKTAKFRSRQNASWSGLGFSPLEVRWMEMNGISGSPSVAPTHDTLRK